MDKGGRGQSPGTGPILYLLWWCPLLSCKCLADLHKHPQGSLQMSIHPLPLHRMVLTGVTAGYTFRTQLSDVVNYTSAA
jgi:hypothetical protein